MIVFDLLCDDGHRFEAWFRSSTAFADQLERRLVACPICSSVQVVKAPMAPAVAPKGNAARPDRADAKQALANAIPAPLAAAMRAVAEAQASALKNSTWVGDRFAEKSRAMHYGEVEQATIHGEATRDEARALAEEGIAVTPLLVPVAPPESLN